ncbi:DUF4153 domain-containing protein [Butyrivibrio sp. AE3004]|uniref:DUF4153 domain-containing protein n=1 Tax=Butyrivibrio sp. AE3004 TaxID=1506994 RepID=UPI0004948E02|nr:DUF4173 domain-containing protein [Butyrivibrio sp. AE3004]
MGNQGFGNNDVYDTESGGEAVIQGNEYGVPEYGKTQFGPATYAGTGSTMSRTKPDGVSFAKYGIIALIYAVVRTICLYQNTSGITYPIYMAVTLFLLEWARKRDGFSIFYSKAGKRGLNIFYIISLMLLSISKCMTANAELLWINEFAIDLLMVCFLLHMYVDTNNWDIIGWFNAVVLTMIRPLANIADPVRDLIEWVTTHGKTINAEKKKNIMAAVIGVCISIPLLAFVIVLLASADAIFSDVLRHAFDFIYEFENIWDVFGIGVMLIWSVWLFYTVVKALSKDSFINEDNKNAGFNPIIAITFSGLLCMVYLFFSVIQIVFLFMGNMTLPAKYTYAEYAHEGFYQLLAVALINLLMVTLCQRLFKKSRVLRVVLIIIGLCTYIMLASSAFRMFMYIKAYNLTFMRVFVLWFLAVMALCLSYLIAGMFIGQLPVFNLCMITVTVMYLIFVFSNPDYQVARYDLARMGEKTAVGPEWDSSLSYYLINEVSEDAVPAFAGNKDLLHEFASSYDHDYRDNKGKYNKIREFNFSKYRAYKILAEATK